MLTNLIVENYALISKLEIDFKKGLTTITGETGAGKSILLGALSLILGKRADTSVLLDKGRKCIVEGTLDITNYNLEQFFIEKSIDYEDLPILRREISPAGKSRAFINDIPVTLEVLSELGVKLIDIHSQYQNLNLANSLFQMKVVDSFAGNHKLLETYRLHYTAYQHLLKKYMQLSDDSGRLKSELDYLLFQFNQLEEAHLKAGEQVELELELEKLTHAEEIKNSLSKTIALLQGDSISSLQQLKECLGSIQRIKQYLPKGDNLVERIETSYIELKDVAHEMEVLNNQSDLDPDKLVQVNDRLNLLYNLEKKHRVKSDSELITLRNNFKNSIEEINSLDFNLEELEKELVEKKKILDKDAEQLTFQRQNAVNPIEKKVIEMLREVGIPSADFSIQLEKLEDFTEHGTNRIQFLFSANKNLAPQEISRIASGGELSRLMLCIKSLISDSIGLPTIVFDEIDTGVSGDIAERVGNIINRMADRMQIINITHLPQVASKGQNHFLVYKVDEDNSSVTRIKLLNAEERQIEIARMLSGEEITSAAMENAKALLGD
jgi:DNA repair protein RecN (Recombination protein N)